MNIPAAITTRRQFVAGTAAGLALLPSMPTANAETESRELKLAVMGSMYNAAHFLNASHIYNASVAAFCDPDQRNVPKILEDWKSTSARLGASANAEDRRWAERYARMSQGEGVKIYSDVRRLFDDMSDTIDALVVSHYDHLHGVACSRALRAGKPVCSERPLGLNISDARGLRELAADSKLPTTYRSPGTGTGEFRRAMELVEDGVIGTVEEVHIWFKRGGPDRTTLPQGDVAVPSDLNWDLWLGPLPWREYHPDWMAYSHWRETCSGGLGIFGPHTAIFPFMTLQMRKLWDRPAGATPIRVTAECAQLNRISFPRWERIEWEIPARDPMPAVRLTWHHGPDFAPGTRELLYGKLSGYGVAREQAEALMKEAGSILIGSDGALLADDHSVHITGLPASKFSEIPIDRPQRIAAGYGIYRDWMDACRGGESTIFASFDNGGPLSELLMLGNIATLFPEETLSYDPAAGRIIDKPAANEHLAFEYRENWTF